MTRAGRVGVIGGMFDPIHCGHVAVAQQSQLALGLDEVILVPSSHPPHRSHEPRASGYDRFAMAALAAGDHPSWRVSAVELERPGLSYTYDTLIEIARGGFAPSQIFFLLGSDAFAEIATWSRYPDVLDLAHFVVVSRAGTTVSSLGSRLPELESRMIGPQHLSPGPSTRVILLEMTTPDVSSTAIRAKAHAGEEIDGLVPAAVAAYISAQGLYRVGSQRPSSVAGR
jgi:nicotinate-nucleotide adenylyltransferase